MTIVYSHSQIIKPHIFMIQEYHIKHSYIVMHAMTIIDRYTSSMSCQRWPLQLIDHAGDDFMNVYYCDGQLQMCGNAGKTIEIIMRIIED